MRTSIEPPTYTETASSTAPTDTISTMPTIPISLVCHDDPEATTGRYRAPPPGEGVASAGNDSASDDGASRVRHVLSAWRPRMLAPRSDVIPYTAAATPTAASPTNTNATMSPTEGSLVPPRVVVRTMVRRETLDLDRCRRAHPAHVGGCARASAVLRDRPWTRQGGGAAHHRRRSSHVRLDGEADHDDRQLLPRDTHPSVRRVD